MVAHAVARACSPRRAAPARHGAGRRDGVRVGHGGPAGGSGQHAVAHAAAARPGGGRAAAPPAGAGWRPAAPPAAGSSAAAEVPNQASAPARTPSRLPPIGRQGQPDAEHARLAEPPFELQRAGSISISLLRSVRGRGSSSRAACIGQASSRRRPPARPAPTARRRGPARAGRRRGGARSAGPRSRSAGRGMGAARRRRRRSRQTPPGAGSIARRRPWRSRTSVPIALEAGERSRREEPVERRRRGGGERRSAPRPERAAACQPAGHSAASTLIAAGILPGEDRGAVHVGDCAPGQLEVPGVTARSRTAMRNCGAVLVRCDAPRRSGHRRPAALGLASARRARACRPSSPGASRPAISQPAGKPCSSMRAMVLPVIGPAFQQQHEDGVLLELVEVQRLAGEGEEIPADAHALARRRRAARRGRRWRTRVCQTGRSSRLRSGPGRSARPAPAARAGRGAPLTATRAGRPSRPSTAAAAAAQASSWVLSGSGVRSAPGRVATAARAGPAAARSPSAAAATAAWSRSALPRSASQSRRPGSERGGEGGLGPRPVVGERQRGAELGLRQRGRQLVQILRSSRFAPARGCPASAST